LDNLTKNQEEIEQQKQFSNSSDNLTNNQEEIEISTQDNVLHNSIKDNVLHNSIKFAQNTQDESFTVFSKKLDCFRFSRDFILEEEEDNFFQLTEDDIRRLSKLKTPEITIQDKNEMTIFDFDEKLARKDIPAENGVLEWNVKRFISIVDRVFTGIDPRGADFADQEKKLIRILRTKLEGRVFTVGDTCPAT
jgi:hypothetical protein